MVVKVILITVSPVAFSNSTSYTKPRLTISMPNSGSITVSRAVKIRSLITLIQDTQMNEAEQEQFLARFRKILKEHF